MSPPARTDARAGRTEAPPAVAAVWASHKPDLVASVEALSRAATELAGGTLGDEQRADAQRTAHKLAGVLGTFGHVLGSQRASEAEAMLRGPRSPGPADAATLARLAAELRTELAEGNGAQRPDPPSTRVDRAPVVMVVDDDPHVVGRLAARAARLGMRAEVAASPAEARTRVTRQRPDAIVLDLAFPQGTADAFALLSELTALTPPVPVLVFTGSDEFADRIEAARRGAMGFLQKSRPPAEAIEQVAQVLERARSTAPRVLVVDDDPAVLEVVRVLLEAQGLEVSTLADPMRFWDELGRVSPALLLLDVDMPDASGIELCQVIRNDPRWAVAPVLFLTAHRDPEVIRQIFAAGADDYLTKPIIDSELVNRVGNRLERFRLHRTLAETDGLTGTLNRRASGEAIGRLVALAGRFAQPLSLAVLDLDHFKRVNDRHGHAAGDAVLRRLGELLRAGFRGEDVVARWGGEEFVVAMYGMSLAAASRRLADLLETFRDEEFRADGERFRPTFSAGVAECPLDGEDLETLYRAADDALYRAKSAGRGCVVAPMKRVPQARAPEGDRG